MITIDSERDERAPNGKRLYDCRCECGKAMVVRSDVLKKTEHCGSCAVRISRTRHGASHTPEHQAWGSMLQRCQNPAHKEFHHYGGRGIAVDERWQVFENFYEDMGARPEGTSLDRIDNERGYSPDNCRWATPYEQQQNRRNNVRYTVNGRTKVLAEWLRETGLPSSTVQNRLRRGWSIHRALTTPSPASLEKRLA